MMNKNQGMPIFIRYVSGNIVNFTTLIHTIRELEQQSVGCAYALLDTEYPTKKNLRDMCDSNIDFMFRLDSGNDSTRACMKKLFLVLCPARTLPCLAIGVSMSERSDVTWPRLLRLRILHSGYRREKHGGFKDRQEGGKGWPHRR